MKIQEKRLEALILAEKLYVDEAFVSNARKLHMIMIMSEDILEFIEKGNMKRLEAALNKNNTE